MRLFIGVWLSESMTEEVNSFIDLIRGNYPGYKWTSKENLHFTLKFLGEVTPERLPLLRNYLNSITQDCFLLRLGSIGYFPSRTCPKIIWLGLERGQEQLITLASSVEASCAQAGFPKSNKPFKPHLTIARAKADVLPVDLPNFNPAFKTETLVSGFSLIESKLFPAGPVYKVIEQFNLVSGLK